MLSSFLTLLIATTLSAFADESYGDLSARLDDVEKKVAGQSPSGHEFATKEDLENLSNQIKELRGRLEVAEHGGLSKPAASDVDSGQKSEMPKDDAAESSDESSDDDDVDAILKDLSSSDPKDTATKKAEKDAPTGTLDKGDETAQYDQAMGLYKKQEYAEAEEAFRFYVKQYPKGKQLSQAKLHIAECQLAQATESKDKKAAKEATADFAAAYKANPKGAHGAQALLGMAKSMKLQGDKKKACIVLKKHKADFPKDKGTAATAKKLSKDYAC
ncbi:MAG: tetratricopeptide repeat protein [Candidatus Paracaedibacteraceae bacterium]|nr:tetratricopeptide repeat protein [Candidatus Paracaedibacteraceae bacterium]